jgi:hypothetical protein
VTKSKALVTFAAVALITAGCGGGSGTESTSAPAKPSGSTVGPSDMSNEQAPPDQVDIDVMIQGGNVTPTNEQVQAGLHEPIVIHVNSDVADELHVHSTPDHTFKIEAKPNQSFQFTVDVPGKVDIELHQLNRTVATIQVQ